MIRSHFLPLLALACLFLTACDPTALTSGQLAFSDEACAPKLFVVSDPVNNRGNAYDLPEGCTAKGTHRRQLRVPSPADGELTLHLYNATPYTTYTRVFGMRDNQPPTQILDCREDDAAYQSMTVTGAGGYDFLVVDVHYGVNGAYGPITNVNTLALAAYDDLTDRRDHIGADRLACDGQTTDELILTTCDRNVNLTEWARELGLEVTDTVGRGGNSVVARAPGRMLVNSTGVPPHKPRQPMKQDSSNVSVEENFIITLPALLDPVALTDNEREAAGLYVGPARNCLAYAPKQRFADRAGTLLAAVIDSGVEKGGTWEADFQRFRSDPLPGTRAGSLGYDFINNDDEPEDKVGHGTSVAGTLIGQYAGETPLRVLHLKVFDGRGRATYAGAVEAIYVAADAGAHLINLSWGIAQSEPPAALRCALDYAQDRGAIVITTAGNASANTDADPQWPGAFARDSFGLERLLTVGSFRYLGGVPELDRARPALFTNYGNRTVDAYAHQTAPMPVLGRDTVAYLFGTSFSAPLLGARLATELSGGRRYGDFAGVLVRGARFRPTAGGSGPAFELPLLEVECPARP